MLPGTIPIATIFKSLKVAGQRKIPRRLKIHKIHTQYSVGVPDQKIRNFGRQKKITKRKEKRDKLRVILRATRE